MNRTGRIIISQGTYNNYQGIINNYQGIINNNNTLIDRSSPTLAFMSCVSSSSSSLLLPLYTSMNMGMISLPKKVGFFLLTIKLRSSACFSSFFFTWRAWIVIPSSSSHYHYHIIIITLSSSHQIIIIIIRSW